MEKESQKIIMGLCAKVRSLDFVLNAMEYKDKQSIGMIYIKYVVAL